MVLSNDMQWGWGRGSLRIHPQNKPGWAGPEAMVKGQLPWVTCPLPLALDPLER